MSASLVESVLKLYQGLIERLPPSDNRTANLQTGNQSVLRNCCFVGCD